MTTARDTVISLYSKVFAQAFNTENERLTRVKEAVEEFGNLITAALGMSTWRLVDLDIQDRSSDYVKLALNGRGHVYIRGNRTFLVIKWPLEASFSGQSLGFEISQKFVMNYPVTDDSVALNEETSLWPYRDPISLNARVAIITERLKEAATETARYRALTQARTNHGSDGR